MQNLVNTQMVAALDINVLEQVSRHLSVSPNTDPKRVIELTTRQVRIPPCQNDVHHLPLTI